MLTASSSGIGTSQDAIGQRWPVYQFEDERADAVGFLEAVNGRDVGVVEGGQYLRFPPETRGRVVEGGCVPARRGKNLQRHVAPEHRILGPVDLAHAAATDQRDDPEMGGESVARPPPIVAVAGALSSNGCGLASARSICCTAAKRDVSSPHACSTTRARSARGRSSADSKMARARGKSPGPVAPAEDGDGNSPIVMTHSV